MSILSDKITDWFKDEGSIANYRQGIFLLERSGVLDILKRLSKPVIIDNGSSLSVMAGQAHYTAGYCEALDQIEYFEQMFKVQALNASVGAPDFGAEEEALKKGHLRPEDLMIQNKGR